MHSAVVNTTQCSLPRTCLRYDDNSKVVFLGLHWFNYLFVSLIRVSDKHFNNKILHTVLTKK